MRERPAGRTVHVGTEMLGAVLLLPFSVADAVGAFQAHGWWCLGPVAGLMAGVILFARWRQNTHRAAEALRVRVASVHRDAAEKRTHVPTSRPVTAAG